MAKRRKTVTVEIAAPMEMGVATANFRTHIDMHLTREQGAALRQLATALDNAKAMSNCGVGVKGGPRRVTTPTGALRWLLEQLASQAEAAQAPNKKRGRPAKTTTTPPPPDLTATAEEHDEQTAEEHDEQTAEEHDEQTAEA